LEGKLKNSNPWRNREGDLVLGSLAKGILLALLLVLATWNPSGYSYLTWMTMTVDPASIQIQVTLRIIASLVLAAGWVWCIVESARYLKPMNVIAAGVLTILSFILLQQIARFDAHAGVMALLWLLQVFGGIVLGMGVTGHELSLLRRRLKEDRKYRRTR
jgi:hypothetical protein